MIVEGFSIQQFFPFSIRFGWNEKLVYGISYIEITCAMTGGLFVINIREKKRA